VLLLPCRYPYCCPHEAGATVGATTAGLGASPVDDEDIDFVAIVTNCYGSVQLAYNPYFSACFFSQNSVFLT
jgi:hypothetical protein